jgi:hypothetical protein
MKIKVLRPWMRMLYFLPRQVVATQEQLKVHAYSQQVEKVHRQEKEGLQLKYPQQRWRVEEEELQVPEQHEVDKLHASHHSQTPFLSCS